MQDTLLNPQDIYQMAEENSSEIILDYNVLDDSITHISDRVTSIFGLPKRIEHAQDYLIRYGVIQPESAQEFLSIFNQICSGEPHVEGILRARDARGSLLWIQFIMTTFFDDAGNPEHAVGILRDITAQQDALLQCADENQHRNILMRESLVYYEADLTSRKILYGTEYFLQSLGIPHTDNYDEILELLIINLVFPEERDEVRATFSSDSLLARQAEGKIKVDLEYRRLTGSGSVIWVHGIAYLSLHPVTHNVMLYFYINDISDPKPREQNLLDYTRYDSLTGLYNRVTSVQKISSALDARTEESPASALMLIRLPNYESVNQKMGHFFGDAMIAELGYYLLNSCAEEDIAGRSGGVEFLLYISCRESVGDLAEKAKQICRSFSPQRLEMLDASSFYPTVGIAYVPEHGTSYKELYKNAALALTNCTKTDKILLYSPYMKELSSPSFSVPEGIMEFDSNFSANIFEYIYKILYNCSDLHSAVTQILELVIRHYGFSRGCMYEVRPDGTYTCTFEWAEPGIRHISDKWRTLSSRQADIILQGTDVDHMKTVLPEDLHPDDPAFGSLALRILTVFISYGKPQGFLCFDSYGKAEADKLLKDKALLHSISQVLDLLQSGKADSNELWENSYLLQHIVDGFKSCTYIVDPSTHLLKYVNQNTRQNICDAVPGSLCYETIRGRTKPCDDCPIDRMIRDSSLSDRSEMYLDRYSMWAQINASLITVPGGKVFGIFNGFDFSDHRRSDKIDSDQLSAFTHDTSLYDALTMSTDDYIFMCDMSTQLFYFPKNMVEEFALPGQIVANAVEVWAKRIHEDDRPPFLEEMNQVFSGQTDTHSMEYRVMNQEGIWVWVRVRGRIERDRNGSPTMFAGVLTNLGNKTSKIDHLTGLPDKYEFEMRTRSMLANDVKSGVLLILGLDNFRYINNLYGWEFGDDVLKESAQRMLIPLPEKVQLYKLDGDKFGAFFPDMDLPAVEDYYHSLFSIFKQNRQYGEHHYFCTVSGGCVCVNDTDTAFSDLYKNANIALDLSKREGKNRLTVYDEKTMKENEYILLLLTRLHESVENGCNDFELYYQPQTEPKTFQVHSAEALLRWHCRDVGLVSPAEFIPLLEQSGLIHKVGRWVIENAAAVCLEWRKIVPDFTVSVNISYLQLQELSFLPYLEREITVGHIDPSMLHLEITESCIADGSRSLTAAFESLRNMGFVIEMDDFGTGYSSLEILKNAPADIVKIDHAFVRDITHSNFDATFIQFVVTLCHSVDIKVCLEGVETWDEYYLVEPMSLDLIQGFLFGRPQKKAEFENHYLNRKLLSPRNTMKLWV